MPPRHRRPATDVLERVGRSMRNSPVKDWGGRLPAMPKTISGGAGRANQLDVGGKTTRVHKAVFYVVDGMDPGTPSGDLQFDRIGVGAQAPIGFEQTTDEMASNGVVASIIMSMTGVLFVDLSLLWTTYRAGGEVSLTLTRDRGGDSITEEVVFETGPLTSRYYNEDEIAIDVVVGDVLTITVPG